MKILIDINHPAHVHYFRNFSEKISELGHETLFVARNKEMAQKLLDLYNIDYIDRGDGKDGFLGKFIYLIYADWKIFQIARERKVDLFLNFLHPYPSHIARILGKPSLVFSDSEHAKMHHKLTVPYATKLFTPSCYNKDLGVKHIRFKGFMELAYLHPDYFVPNPDIFRVLGLNEGDRYIIVRFVSWKAVHDVGHSGLSFENKMMAVKLFEKYAKVFISSEGELPKELEKYKLSIPIDRIHDVLYYSDMIFGESATMSSEAAILGTPAIYISSIRLGYLDQLEEEFGLVCNYSNTLEDQQNSIQKAIEILDNPLSKESFKKKKEKLIQECEDTTRFMVSVVQKYFQESLTV